MVTADSVPPAERIGPAIETERYSLPSLFFLILTSLIPCSGAIVTPSVTMAKPTLTARSSLSSSAASGAECFPRAISFESMSAESSLPLVFNSVRRGSAISISCIFATLSARSKTIFGSIMPEESTRADLAAAAASYIVYVAEERSE